MSKVIHYAVLLLLLVGVLVWWMKPPTINPITDPRAAGVGPGADPPSGRLSHDSPGLNERARIRGPQLGGPLGEWQVIKQDEQRYEVRIYMREQGTTQWFERDFIWHVDLATKRVNAASLPADGLMPEGPDSTRPVDPRTARRRFRLQCKRHLHLHIRTFDAHLDARDADLGILPAARQ